MPHRDSPGSVLQDPASAANPHAGVIDPQERIDVLLAHLGTRASGLSSREAERRVAQYGRNEITRTAQRSRVRELAHQLVHPLALLLWVAAALASASGKPDTGDRDRCGDRAQRGAVLRTGVAGRARDRGAARAAATTGTGVHAALLARSGRLAEALEMLRLTVRIDLDDIGHMTPGGLHLAAMGNVWRTLALGFAGLRPVGDALAIDPMLAPEWDTLELRVRSRNSRVRVRVRPDSVEASADPPVPALTPAGERIQLGRTPQSFPSSPRRTP